MSRELLGSGHRNTARLAHNYAVNLRRIGNAGGALHAYRQAIASYEKAFGPDSPELSEPLLAMEEFTFRLGKAALRERRERIERALRLCRNHYGEQSEEYARLLVRAGDVYRQRMPGDWRGLRYLRQGHKLSEKLLGRDSDAFANAAFALGRYEMQRGWSKQALQHLNEAWEFYSGIPLGDVDMQLSVLVQLLRANVAVADMEEAVWNRELIRRTAMSAKNVNSKLILRGGAEKPRRSDFEKDVEWVRVRYTIDEVGSVVDPVVARSSGNAKFHQPALDAARLSLYTPKVVNGIPVKIHDVSYTYYFRR